MVRRTLIAFALAAALAVAMLPAVPAPPAEARTCKSVGSFTVVAQRMSCRYARRHVRRWVRTNRGPRGWSCVRKRRKSLSCARGNRAFGAFREQSRRR